MGDELILASGARVESPLVVRVAGLPAWCLSRLRCAESFSRVENLVALRDRLVMRGEALSVELHGIIGSLAAPRLKPVLIGLRRALHQMRAPGAREWNERVAGALPAEVSGRVRGWIADWGEYRRLREELPDVLAREVAGKEVVLREAAAQAGFRRALSQASPALFAELAKWLAGQRRAPRQQTMVRLAQYVGRAAAKTSPYSTFTASAVGGWVDAGVAARFTGPTEVMGVLELHGMLLAALERFVREDPKLASSLRLRVNPSVVRQDDRISFLGRAPKESIVTLPATPAVQRCLAIVAGDPGCTLGGLCARLAEAGADVDRVTRFVDGLLAAGLLELRSPVPAQAADPVGELAGWLAGRGKSGYSDVVALLERIRRELEREVPVSDVDCQLTRQEALCDAVGQLSVRIGRGSPGRTTPKVTFHENAVVIGSPVACGSALWRPALEDLDVIRRCLAPFDPALPLRLALGALCAERFGAGCGVSLLSVYRAVHDELRRGDVAGRTVAGREIARLMAGGPTAPDLGASPLPGLRQLHRIQDELRQTVLAGARRGDVLRVDPGALAGIAAQWPEWVRPPRSMGSYLQVVTEGRQLRLVLNAAHVGHGRGRSRLSRLIAKAGGTTMGNGAWPARDPVLAEFGGLFGSTLNVRHAAAPYEIDYPFTDSGRPAAERIALGELTVVHDRATDQVRLVCPRLGCEVRPVHLGMMADVLLPPVARFLALTFGSALALRGVIPVPLIEEQRPEPESFVKAPRVEVGNVVLRRARWIGPIDAVPRRHAGEADAEFLVRLVAWLRKHGIPTQCFVRAMAHRPGDVAADRTRWASLVFDSTHKPIYVDFASWHLVRVFERRCAHPAAVVVIEEALPAPHEAVGPAGPDRRATEFLVEISDRSGGHG